MKNILKRCLALASITGLVVMLAGPPFWNSWTACLAIAIWIAQIVVSCSSRHGILFVLFGYRS